MIYNNSKFIRFKISDRQYAIWTKLTRIFHPIFPEKPHITSKPFQHTSYIQTILHFDFNICGFGGFPRGESGVGTRDNVRHFSCEHSRTVRELNVIAFPSLFLLRVGEILNSLWTSSGWGRESEARNRRRLFVMNVSRSTDEFYVFCMPYLNYVSRVRCARIGYRIVIWFDVLSFDL